MKIIPVRSDYHMKQFVRLPERLFGELADFIPPLWSDEKKDYTALHNPILAVSEFQLLLAYDDHNKPVGRLIITTFLYQQAMKRSKTSWFTKPIFCPATSCPNVTMAFSNVSPNVSLAFACATSI